MARWVCLLPLSLDMQEVYWFYRLVRSPIGTAWTLLHFWYFGNVSSGSDCGGSGGAIDHISGSDVNSADQERIAPF